jgi:hypothetical protein
MRRTGRVSFGAKFVVKYWQIWYAKYENRECCPQHEALNAFSAGVAFLAVTIAIPEPFLLPTAENWRPALAQLQGKFWRQIRSLIFIAKPRRRTDSDHNTEL